MLYYLKSIFTNLTLLISVFLLTACSATQIEAQTQIQLPADSQKSSCDLPASYDIIIKESSFDVDEVSSRIAGTMARCEFSDIPIQQQVAMGEDIANHLKLLLMNIDEDFYDSYSSLLTEWIEHYHTELLHKKTSADKKNFLLLSFLLAESAIWKRQLLNVTSASFDELIDAYDQQAFHAKFDSTYNQLLDKIEKLLKNSNSKNSILKEVEHRLEGIKLDLHYLKTGNPCSLLSMDLYMYLEDRLEEGCQASALKPR